MRNLVSEYATQFRQDRQKQIRLVAILAALAVVVAGVVFWQLHNTGVAMTNEVFCGQEEHVHDDNCYAEVLTCDLEESDAEGGHIHSEECYETVLTCEIPEHIHTIECLTDESADVETADDWEATLPEELSGVWSDDVVAVAESQVGYTESTANFQLGEDGETRQGYTRYGAWYGNEYGDWDAMFAAFCLNYAGISEEEMPYNSGAYAWTAALSDSDLYVESDAFTPRQGDLIFFDTDEDETADAVGIITAIDEDTGVLTVIEGNSDDAAAENTYDADSEIVIGYGLLPEQTVDEDAEVTVAAEDGAADAEDTEIENDETTVLTYEGADYTVEVSYGADAGLPDEAELVVSEYLKDTPGYLARYAEASDLYGWEDGDADSLYLLDIGLVLDGEKVEVSGNAQVTISWSAAEENDLYYVITCFSPEAESVKAESAADDDVQSVSFYADLPDDVLVAAVNDIEDGIVTLSASRSWFTFIQLEDTLANAHGSGSYSPGQTIDDGYNKFYIMDDQITPVSSSDRLTLNYRNMELEKGSEGLLSIERFEYDYNGTHYTPNVNLILMDISSLTGGSSSGRIPDSRFESNVSNGGQTLEDVGSVRFTNAGTIDEKSVDVIMTINSVRLYNSHAEDYVAHNTSYSLGLPKDNKISICHVTSSGPWVGLNYLTGYDDINKIASKYDGTYHIYPCLADFDITLQVVESGTTNVVGKPFLHVASDIDIYDASDSTAWQYGYFAETFKTLKGFSGSYYIYSHDTDNIVSYNAGEVWCQATEDTGNTSGNDSYIDAGIYADTNTGTWSVGYSEGWCSTMIEIYNYDTNDITIKKVDSTDQTKTLEGAEFILYKYEDGAAYYYSGYSDQLRQSYWSTDEEEAMPLTTGSDGLAYAYYLEAGTYYLQETSAPDKYNPISHVIEFEITTYGIINPTTTDPDIYLDPTGSLTITVLDTPNMILPNTGGIGTWIFTAAGLLIVGSAATALIYRKRRVVRS